MTKIQGWLVVSLLAATVVLLGLDALARRPVPAAAKEASPKPLEARLRPSFRGFDESMIGRTELDCQTAYEMVRQAKGEKVEEMYALKRAASVPPGTRAVVLERGPQVSRIQLLDGSGRVGYIPTDRLDVIEDGW